MDFLVVTQDIGGQTAWSGSVENYTGYQFIAGPELVAKFQEHMRKYNISVKENESVVQLKKKGDVIFVKTSKSEYESRTVVIASGKKSRELFVPGEKEFKNKGLSYCATCDGPLFNQKVVAVIGGGNSALDAALQLMRIAKHIYIINNVSQLSADAVMQEKVMQSESVTVFNNTTVTAIRGEKFVNQIQIRMQNREEKLAVQGVFVEIGLIPASAFAQDLAKNQLGEIEVNCNNETNIPGIFAAGDVTDVYDKQIIIAAGEGAKASLSAFRYLAKHRF
jgi:alkyl hydroperoxide reductase subunit F